jgi:hypothetical protein
MSKSLAAIGLMCCMLCAVAVADGPTGIFTYVTYSGSPQDTSDIECWYKTYAMEDWAYHSTHSTTEQNNSPYYNYLRWAHSSQSQPRIPIATGAWYTFMAKSYVGGGWKYSEWSSGVNYPTATTWGTRTLALTRTTDPGDPPSYGGGD